MTSLDVVLLTILFGHLSTLSVKIYWLQGSTYNTGLPGHFQIRWGQAYVVGCNLNPTVSVQNDKFKIMINVGLIYIRKHSW